MFSFVKLLRKVLGAYAFRFCCMVKLHNKLLLLNNMWIQVSVNKAKVGFAF